MDATSTQNSRTTTVHHRLIEWQWKCLFHNAYRRTNRQSYCVRTRMQTIESELSSSSRYSWNKEDIKSVNSITAVTTTVIVAMTMENSSRHLTWEGDAISNSKDSVKKDSRNKNIQDLMLQLTTTRSRRDTQKKN